ncbi:MAG: aconitate hydratase [Akkermansiaceae bacterium]|nr:aconitate hydratase [Akkermansiaceae bacterium]
MNQTLTHKIIEAHLEQGEMKPGAEVAIRIDQTLTQDATGTLVMLEFEALGLPRVKTEVSAQYVDHNLIQEDFKNPDDHMFLLSAARKYGLWFSPAGNGVSHPVHQERFGAPGKTLVGSDSHTPAAGALGMFAVGAGGLEAALAMAGEPLHLKMPRTFGVELTGKLPDFVSAKDVILEMLRRHGVRGADGHVIEYHGEGLENLTVMDRHVIANMGTELGATTTMFPSDGEARRFLEKQGRGEDWTELLPDEGCRYDKEDHIELSELVPLIAKPSSPGNVVAVSEVEGEELYQAYIGSSANPGLRDFAIVAMMLEDEKLAPGVSLDINPSSRQTLANLIREGYLHTLIRAGARIHQAGCNGCIGMGQAPATDANSLRTVPRNFPGRSGTREDRVFLCSPETAAASAIRGRITDPRNLDMEYPRFKEPDEPEIITDALIPPGEGEDVELRKGPNIVSLPELAAPDETFSPEVILKVGDDISTDGILPAGARVLPYRSNLPEISKFAFKDIDGDFYERASNCERGFIIVAGENYGQGSSREHAALAPRYLGLRAVIAKSFSRIHRQNLVNFGVIPLTFANPDDYERLEQGDELDIEDWLKALRESESLVVCVKGGKGDIEVEHQLSTRQIDAIAAGSLIELVRKQKSD